MDNFTDQVIAQLSNQTVNGVQIPTQVITVTHTIVDPMSLIVIQLLILAASIFFHELGHAMVLRHYGKDHTVRINFNKWFLPKITTGINREYYTLSKEQLIKVYSAGIGLGALFILLVVWALNPIFLVAFSAYVVGSWGDVEKMWYVWRKKE